MVAGIVNEWLPDWVKLGCCLLVVGGLSFGAGVRLTGGGKSGAALGGIMGGVPSVSWEDTVVRYKYKMEAYVFAYFEYGVFYTCRE